MASIQSVIYKKVLRHTIRGGVLSYERVLKTRRSMDKGFLAFLRPKKSPLAPTWVPRESPRDRAQSTVKKATKNASKNTANNIAAETTSAPSADQTSHPAGFQGLWLGAPDAHDILYYLHGGGYVIGSPATHRDLVENICAAADMKAFVPDYRLAPEHPFPAALDDSLAGYRWLLAQGYQADRIHFAGDSAGGGLALASCLRAKQENLPQPKSLTLLSPWTDLTVSGASYTDRAERDPMLAAKLVPDAVAFYIGSHDASNPLISPLWGDLSGLPPVYVQVGTEEILFSDSAVLVEKIRAAGGTAELEIWPDMPHVHQLAFRFVPEGRQAIQKLAENLRQNRSQ